MVHDRKVRRRTAALGAVAAGALMFGYGRTARAQIVPPAPPCDAISGGGTTVTCTGNLQPGVRLDNGAGPYTTLNVNTLNQNIAPANGVGGIRFRSIGDVTINSDTGPFEINTTGLAFGIDALSVTSSATVNHTGNISSELEGIIVLADQAVSVTTTGDITSERRPAIDARSINSTVTVVSNGNLTSGLNAATLFARGAQAVNVSSTGNVTSSGFNAIAAESTGSSSTVNSKGAVRGYRYGIFAEGDQAVSVTSTGNVSSDTYVAISAQSASSTANVISIGNVSGGALGIVAAGYGAVAINSTGNVSGNANEGIYGTSGNASVSITSRGNVSGVSYGILAYAYQDANVDSTGNVASAAVGIRAFSTNSDVTVRSKGNIDSTSVGIFGYALNGAVDITTTGNVTSTTSIGVYAKTLSGGVDVVSNGNVSSANYGILVYSSGGDVTVTTSGGTVNGPANGIYTITDTSGVTITNLAGGTVTGGTYAIQSDSSTGSAVNNSGTVTGSVLFNGGGANNAFNNNGGGIFNSGPIVNLGAGNLLRNAGTLAPGGSGALQTTALTGNINQTASGIFQVDVDSTAGTSDLLNVTGTANLNGNVLAQVVNPALGPQSNTILSAAGGTTDNGLGLLASPALQASLSFPNATDVVLNTDIDFTPPGVALNQNQNNVASNLNAIVGAGGGTVGPVLLALLNNVQTVPDYVDGLNQLITEGYLNTETTSLFAAEAFNNNLLSCPKAGPGFTAVSQGQCMWVRYDGRWLDRDSTRQNIGYDEDTHGISGGGQVAVAPNWFVGLAAAYEDGDLDTDTNASADTDRYMLGGVIKYQSGPVLMALAGSIGTGEVDMTRRLNIGGFTPTARSSYDVDHVGATFHAAYLLDRSSWYAKPFVDVNVTHIDRESAQETGGGAANLNVSGSDETWFSVTPALELGTTIDRGDGRAIRPYVRAGVTIYGDTDQSVTARFVGAPTAVGGFTTTSEFDDVFADIEAGVTLFHGEQHTVSAGYGGRFSDDTEVHGFFVKGTRTF